ncbi:MULTISPECIES: hypothetical protein [Ferrimicrobium]|uniref:hypothetical protein n=1 Tax=Ferrimicrobium TaxID=121038 RepID=UPI0023F3CF49|nr:MULTISPECIES: hypothetical protein [Ferrimicrobium]
MTHPNDWLTMVGQRKPGLGSAGVPGSEAFGGLYVSKGIKAAAPELLDEPGA